RDRGARPCDLARDRLLLRGDARELVETPRIGLLEVDARAEEVPRPQRVALAPRRVLGGCGRGELAAEEGREPRVRGGGRAGPVLELPAHPLARRGTVEDGLGLGSVDEGREERRGRVGEG